MRAIVLAAGRGSRLQPLTNTMPKPLVMVDGKTLLEHQLHALAAAGINEICVNLHWLGDRIYHFLQNRPLPCRIHYQWEQPVLNTGGAIASALEWLCHRNDTFLVVNADIIHNFSLKLLIDQSAPCLAIHPITKHTNDNIVGDFALIDGLLTRAEPREYVFCGISKLHRDMFVGVPSNPFPLLEVLLHAVNKHRLRGYIHTGTWSDVGSWQALQRHNWTLPKLTETMHDKT